MHNEINLYLTMQKDLTLVPEQQSLVLTLLIMSPMNVEQGTKKKEKKKKKGEKKSITLNWVRAFMHQILQQSICFMLN